MFSIIVFLALISAVVFIHEYGHYYFARKYGLKVTRFLIFGVSFANEFVIKNINTIKILILNRYN